MITCPECGAENVAGARFCQSCGSLLRPAPGTGTLPVNAVMHGRYRVIKKIGQGGMAYIYLVEDLQNPGQRWALKEMRDDLLPVTERLPAIQSFQREADLLSRLNHPALPRVVDYFSEEGRHYLVMEYLEGETLQERIDRRRRPFREEEVIDWAIQICNILEYLHGQNPPIIYRDLKPGNLMIDRDGRVRLFDFGIARYFDPSKRTDTLKMGTVGYAPPEQYQGGGQCDARSDIYALGATMYYLLTGRDPQDMPPFSFGQARPKKVNPRLSDWIDQVVMTALAYNPNDRFQSAGTMRAVLQNPGRPLIEPTRPMPSIEETAVQVTDLTHPISHLPQMEELYWAALTEAERELAPQVAQEEERSRQEKARQEAWYHEGIQAVRRGEWRTALEIADRLREVADSPGVFTLSRQAEEGWLASLFPARAHPPFPASAVRDWETFSGKPLTFREFLREVFVPPRPYPTMDEILRRHRLLVLQGPPGIGKYSCALALARALRKAQEGLGEHLLEGDISPAEIAGRHDQILIWRHPFGESTFVPPYLADRPDLLEEAMARNCFLILTTPTPPLELALASTALGWWPPLAEARVSLERPDYTDEAVAEILDRHAQVSCHQGWIAPRQRELLADPARRLEMAMAFPFMLLVPLFIQHALAGLDPHLPWSTEDLQQVAAGLHALQPAFSRWFADQDAPTRLLLGTLLWLEGRPRREIWETYLSLTRKLQSLHPGLPAASTERLAHRAFCLLEEDGRLRFAHPVYREIARQVISDLEHEYLLECLGEIEQAVVAAAVRDEAGDRVPAQAALLLGELAGQDWDRVVPVLEKLAREADSVRQALGRGLAYAVQRRPALLPSAVSLLRRWLEQPDVELPLAAGWAIRQLAPVAPEEVWPLAHQLAGHALPAARLQAVEVAARLSPQRWEKALEILRRLGEDAEASVREATAGRLAYLARWRRRALLEMLLIWAEANNNHLDGTIARALLLGRETFAPGETIPLYRRLLSRWDEAGETLVAFLSDPTVDTTPVLTALTELAACPTEEILQVLDRLLQDTAWQQPRVVLQILDSWGHHENRTVRWTALNLLSRVGQAPLQQPEPTTGLRTLGSAYAEEVFRILKDLAADPVLKVRAQFLYLIPDFARMDAGRTVDLLDLLTRDPEVCIRQMAAVALAPFAARYADRIVPLLESLVVDQAVPVREATIPALGEVARADVIPALTLLSTLVRDPATSRPATSAFVSVGASRVVEATPVLAALGKDTHSALRTAILEVAAQSGPDHPQAAVTFLSPLADDPDPTIRRRVGEVCHRIAQADAQAPLELLTRLVQDTQPDIRERALEVLTAAGLRVPQAGLRAFRELFRGRSEVKLLALQAIRRFIPDHAQQVLETMDPLLGDPDLSVRQAAIPALGEAGDRQPAMALERLGRLLGDPDERVSENARGPFLSLCARKNPSLLPILRELALKSPFRTALIALQGLDNFAEEQPAAVVEILRLLGEQRPEIRAALYPLLEHTARVYLTGTIGVLTLWLEGPRADESARRLYWRIMRLPEGSPIVTAPRAVVRTLATNPNWSTAEARKALTLAEEADFLRRRVWRRITRRL